MSDLISLFQQQSYKDAWDNYEETLKKRTKLIMWDYIVLTASNEDQATSYQAQIDHRLKLHKLPSKTNYVVLSDPEGKRVGSGGATLNVLRYIARSNPSKEESFRNIRILVIHSGGDSKRVPQYSACGKLFSPVPRVLPDGRRSTLFDEFIIAMSGVASRMSAGMLVCAAALSIRECKETGKDHGVYLKDENGNVGRFLHKQTIETLDSLGAIDQRGNVNIDTGSVIFQAEMLIDLFKLIDTDEKFNKFVNEKTRLSFYADFLYPLASHSTLEKYYLEIPEGDFTPELHECRKILWDTLHKYQMKLICLSPGSFIHFGTTIELLNLVNPEIDRYHYLGWSKHVKINSTNPSFAGNNSFISPNSNIGQGCFIEDSYIDKGTNIGKNCVISCVTLNGQTIPDNVVLHCLKLNNGKYCVRIYGINDNPKESKIFDINLSESLWSKPLYPVRDSVKDAVDATLAVYSQGFTDIEDNSLSLMSSYQMADVSSIIPWQNKLNDYIEVESLLYVIKQKGNLFKAIKAFNGSITPCAEAMLNEKASSLSNRNLEDFSCKIRIYYALSLLFTDEKHDNYLELCFGSIRNGILQQSEFKYDKTCTISCPEVTVELPVRVNWGGGWSDTPPYCMENGGNVLNASIVLNGRKPVKVTVKKINEHKIIFSSEDNGSYEEFTSLDPLQCNNNPFDPFALHKSALIACGIIPYSEKVDFDQLLTRLGGGISLCTQVENIPRGSGLGTSSILAGACAKAISQFLGKTPTDCELFNYVLCMEQIMSTGGGWQDQIGGLINGIKMINTISGMHQNINFSILKIPDQALQELNDRFCLIYTGQRRLARNLLRDIIGKYVGGDEEAVEVLYEIQRIAVLMKLELEKGNIDRFSNLLNEHWELAKKLDKECTNTCIEQIFLAVKDLICGKMICGAGGGGFLQVILKKDVKIQQLRERLLDVYQDIGVDVWECSLK
ncbi:bifunctional fucokinase/L-fucose-1-P-guanylyltransferase [Histomonas meleagridis]|uniref:bifunctional fucokinase/L-fucose-1-P-guanylyltransferase n=1 Tax=Histomonas meleagridis TaxID=135588 RepID=UPI00355A126D|nr:bifunctional fucokinase/L-fucose-1-P-guanylyltransferase [Histomonas meleagridis]KAH0798344.1 bifunctional fucokinase/L-fucose-1-P-guanylyltransferase [Histomonas meleagridis]